MVAKPETIWVILLQISVLSMLASAVKHSVFNPDFVQALLLLAAVLIYFFKS